MLTPYRFNRNKSHVFQQEGQQSYSNNLDTNFNLKNKSYIYRNSPRPPQTPNTINNYQSYKKLERYYMMERSPYQYQVDQTTVSQQKKMFIKIRKQKFNNQYLQRSYLADNKYQYSDKGDFFIDQIQSIPYKIDEPQYSQFLGDQLNNLYSSNKLDNITQDIQKSRILQEQQQNQIIQEPDYHVLELDYWKKHSQDFSIPPSNQQIYKQQQIKVQYKLQQNQLNKLNLTPQFNQVPQQKQQQALKVLQFQSKQSHNNQITHKQQQQLMRKSKQQQSVIKIQDDSRYSYFMNPQIDEKVEQSSLYYPQKPLSQTQQTQKKQKNKEIKCKRVKKRKVNPNQSENTKDNYTVKVQATYSQNFIKKRDYPHRLRTKPLKFWQNQKIQYKKGKAIAINNIQMNICNILNMKDTHLWQHHIKASLTNFMSETLLVDIKLPLLKQIEFQGIDKTYKTIQIHKQAYIANSSFSKVIDKIKILLDDGIRVHEIKIIKLSQNEIIDTWDDSEWIQIQSQTAFRLYSQVVIDKQRQDNFKKFVNRCVYLKARLLKQEYFRDTTMIQTNNQE